VEVKLRLETEASRVPVDTVVDSIQQILEQEAAAYTLS
jgi:hypothetical protein